MDRRSIKSISKTSRLAFAFAVVFSISLFTGQKVFAAAEANANAEPEQRYNEVFDQTGQVREHYRLILPLWTNGVQHMQEFERKTFEEFRRPPFESNTVADIPRMIPKEEYDHVVRGVQQRERALQAFLRDHYSGEKRYAREGIVSESTVNSIIIRNGEWGYQSLINGNTPINFLYGPDLIRGPDGEYRALEDNLGFVGGPGDIILAQQISSRQYPVIDKNYNYPRAIEFFHGMMDVYARQARNFGGKIVYYSDANITSDSEDTRMQEIYAQLGYENITPKSQRRLSFEKDGVYVQGPKGEKREKVGFIIFNPEHSYVDLSHPASLEKAILDHAASVISSKPSDVEKEKQAKFKMIRKKLIELVTGYDEQTTDRAVRLKKIKKLIGQAGEPVHLGRQTKKAWGIVSAILDGRVGASYSPGAEFVSDKQIYIYVEDFIRFYLHEEPIIRNVETYMFNMKGTSKVNKEVLDRVFGTDRKGDDLKNWVIKPVDGRGGSGIIFGREVTPEKIPALIRKISEMPYRLQAQRNTPPSLMPANRITDIRPLTYSTRETSVVSPVPWSRSASLDKSRLINVSSGGAVSSAFVISKKPKPQLRCESLFVSR